MNELKSPRFLMIAALILLAAFSRLIPHPANATAMGAIAIFGGAAFRNKGTAFLMTFTALILSDAVLGFYPGIWVTYMAFALVIGLGMLLKERLTPRNIFATSILSSVIFYLLTNFAFIYPSTLYPHTWNGVVESYAGALPFFRNELIATLFFSLVLFGSLGFINEKVLKRVKN